MALVEIQNISKVYKMGKIEVHALRGINLKIEQGMFIVILGPSGSGKTTLLNIIGGMDTPSNGRVIFEGQEVPIKIKKLAEHRRENIGFVFQFLNLLPTLTTVENVELALELVGAPSTDGTRDFSKKAIRERATHLLTKIGLGNRLHHFPAELSGGEQQRVSIARALAKDPPLIVGDEPTGSLDFNTGIDVLTELLRLSEEEEKTVLLVTHNREISKIADIIIEIRDGQIGKMVVNPDKVKPDELRW